MYKQYKFNIILEGSLILRWLYKEYFFPFLMIFSFILKQYNTLQYK